MTRNAIRVISERMMSRGYEPSVQRLMDGIRDRVKVQPGLISIEQLKDTADHHKYVVLTKVLVIKVEIMNVL